MLHPVRGVLCIENEQTGDGRIIMGGALTWADLPLPFACLTGDQHARGESEQVGTIDTITRVGNLIGFTGFVDDQIEQGAAMVRQMQAGSAPLGAKFGVSIDPDDWEVELVDTNPGEDEMVLMLASGHGRFPAGHLSMVAAAGEGDPGGGVIMEDSADSLIERYTRLRIRGATACSVAAFDGAYVELVTEPAVAAPVNGNATSGNAAASGVTVTIAAEGETVDGFAAHGPFSGSHSHDHSAYGTQGSDSSHSHSHSHANDAVHDHHAVVTASSDCDDCDPITAAGGPLLPPLEWFQNPQFKVGDGRLVRQPDGSHICPLTVVDDGRVFGHMAGWNSCHTGYVDRCVTPPRSPSGYSFFNDGPLPTAEGETVHVGQLTMGCGHPNESMARPLNWKQAKAHYDGGPNAIAMADVVAGEDEFGIWFAGALRSDVTDAQVRAFRACSVSGDWREVVPGRGIDLIACAAGVISEGFQMARLAASADLDLAGCLPSAPQARFENGRPTVLVASGMVRQPMPWERALGDAMARIDTLEARVERAEAVTFALRGQAAESWLAAAGLPPESAV